MRWIGFGNLAVVLWQADRWCHSSESIVSAPSKGRKLLQLLGDEDDDNDVKLEHQICNEISRE